MENYVRREEARSFLLTGGARISPGILLFRVYQYIRSMKNICRLPLYQPCFVEKNTLNYSESSPELPWHMHDYGYLHIVVDVFICTRGASESAYPRAVLCLICRISKHRSSSSCTANQPWEIGFGTSICYMSFYLVSYMAHMWCVRGAFLPWDLIFCVIFVENAISQCCFGF